MPWRVRGLKLYLLISAISMLLGVLACAWIADRPDFDLHFVREVPVQATPEILDKTLSGIANWPQWFFKTTQAQRIDITGQPFPFKDQVLAKGALLQISVNPKKGPHRHYELFLEVTDYTPKSRVSLRLMKDTSGKLAALFDRLEWTIEILPGDPSLTPPMTRVRGTETARTRNWRSRLFGVIAEHILMNQAFYPDLIKLGSIMQPQVPSAPSIFEQ